MENKQNKKTLTLIKKENNLTEEELKLKNDLLEIENLYSSINKVADEIKKENKDSLIQECEDLYISIAISLYSIKLEEVLKKYMKVEEEISNEF